MKNKLSEEVIVQVQKWKGYNAFNGVELEFRSQDPDIFDGHQHTVLMEAVSRGETSVVDALIKAGANVNAVNIGTQQTPLLCFPSSIADEPLPEKIVNEITIELIKAGADINYLQKFENEEYLEDHFGTPLIDACSEGRIGQVKILIGAGADANLSWRDGLSAICRVDDETGQHIGILKELISAGADVNAYGGNALQSAIKESDVEAMQLLIKAGARTDIKSPDNYYSQRTAFMSLLKGSAVDLGSDEEEELCQLFFEVIGNVNTQDDNGRSLIFYAIDMYIGGDDFDIWMLDKIMFSNEVAINQTDNSGNTALNSLLLALEKEGELSEELYDDARYKIETLLIAGADPKISNKGSVSSLKIAERTQNKDLIELLENPERVINSENYSGRTPLFIASVQGHLDKIKWLIKKGAYVNAKNKCHIIPRGVELYGSFIHQSDDKVKPKLYTALMAAQNIEIIRLLIGAGADINAIDSEGNTALMLYARGGWVEGANELIQAGANTNTLNKRYENALNVGKRAANSSEITKLLKERTSKSLSASIFYVFFYAFSSR